MHIVALGHMYTIQFTIYIEKIQLGLLIPHTIYISNIILPCRYKTHTYKAGYAEIISLELDGKMSVVIPMLNI